MGKKKKPHYGGFVIQKIQGKVTILPSVCPRTPARSAPTHSMAKKKAGKGSAKQEAKELKKKKQEEKASKAAKKKSGKVLLVCCWWLPSCGV